MSPRIARIAPVALVVATMAGSLAACGGTRYVVVQPSSPSGATATAPAPAAGPEADASTTQAVTDAVEAALGLDDRPFTERTDHLTDDAGDLADTYAAVLQLVSTIDASVRVDSVAATGDTATATVTIVVDGADYASGVPVSLVRTDDAWKVTREGACAALAIGSPCPG